MDYLMIVSRNEPLARKCLNRALRARERGELRKQGWRLVWIKSGNMARAGTGMKLMPRYVKLQISSC